MENSAFRSLNVNARAMESMIGPPMAAWLVRGLGFSREILGNPDRVSEGVDGVWNERRAGDDDHKTGAVDR